jgi:hypothetical protein
MLAAPVPPCSILAVILLLFSLLFSYVLSESDIAAMTRIERDTADDSGTFSLLIVEPTRSTCSLALLVSFGGALLA